MPESGGAGSNPVQENNSLLLVLPRSKKKAKRLPCEQTQDNKLHDFLPFQEVKGNILFYPKEEMKMEEKLKIICPFCNKEWTAKMETEYTVISEGCDTCGYGAKAVVTVEIRCDNCGKIVYRKETK